MASEADLLKQAHFVFKGTITESNASAMPGVSANRNTAVVRVEQIAQAPAALSHCGGHDITVLLAGDQPVSKGDAFTFFTNEWLYGKGVAVRSLAQLPVQQTAASFATAGSDPVRTLAHRRLAAHVEDADLVVTGRVTSVALPGGEAGAAATAGTAPPPRLLAPREHDPHWREAVVEIHQVHKGSHPTSTVRVRFPASHDRMWFNVPKLQPGHQGHFILHRSRPAEALRAAAAPDAAAQEVYSVLHPEDFQNIAETGGLRQVLNLPD